MDISKNNFQLKKNKKKNKKMIRRGRSKKRKLYSENTSYKKPKLKKSSVPKMAPLKKKNNIEIKTRDQYYASSATQMPLISNLAYVAPDNAGAGMATGYTCVNLTSQGTSTAQRIGNKITLKSIRVRGCCTLADNATLLDNGQIRVLLVYDKQTNGTAPGYATILSSIDSTGAQTTVFQSQLNIVNSKRFVILRDESFPLSFYSLGTIQFDYYVKKPMEMLYSGTSTNGAIGDVVSGAIYLLAFRDGQFTQIPVIQEVHSRIRFYD